MKSREKIIGYYKNIWRILSDTYLKFDINKCFGEKIKILEKTKILGSEIRLMYRELLYI